MALVSPASTVFIEHCAVAVDVWQGMGAQESTTRSADCVGLPALSPFLAAHAASQLSRDGAACWRSAAEVTLTGRQRGAGDGKPHKTMAAGR